MPRSPDVDGWIQAAKLATSAGEMAPFPFIKGAAGCVTVVLEAIEKAGKNDEDLRTLAEDIEKTKAYMDFQKDLKDILAKLDVTQNDLERKRFKRLLKALKARKVSDAINGFTERVNTIKTNYALGVITKSGAEMPKIRDTLSTRITEVAEASQLCITSTVESQYNGIIGAIHNLGELQKEHITQICEMVPEKAGYYKGVRDLAFSEIRLIRKIPCIACHPGRRFLEFEHTCEAVCGYQDGYCTVVNNNEANVIRMYRPSINNERDIMNKLCDDIDIFIKPKHPNFAQVFGVCISPIFPAIVFHDKKQTPVEEYLNNIPKKEFIQLYIQFIYERESVLNHLRTYYPPDTITWADSPKPNDTYIDERNMLVVASISQTYLLGTQWHPVLPPGTTMEFENSKTRNAPSLNSLRGSIRSGLEKPHILSVYTIIHHHCETWTKSQVVQCYAPGSISTFHGNTLVGRARDSLGIWIVDWMTWSKINGSHHSHDVYDSGSITVGSKLTEDSTVPLLHAGIVPYSLKIFPASSLAYSWIAQASQLDSFLHSGGHVVDDDLYMIDGYWKLYVKPKYRHTQDCFPLYDTFMADDPHILSLLIHAPLVDDQTNKMSFPVLSWLYGADTEMLLEEVEEFFNVKVDISWQPVPSLQLSILTAVPELNAEYGFNPTQGGIDVCKHYGLPILELFDAPQFMSESIMSSTEEHMSIISDGARQAFYNEGGSPQESIIEDTIKGIERVHNDEVPTEAQIITVSEHSIYFWHQELLIVVFTFIATLLLFFIVQSYL